MGLLRKLRESINPPRPVESVPPAQPPTTLEWVDVDNHDGSGFIATVSMQPWTSDDWGEMVHEGLDLRDSDGRLLHRNSCGATRWQELGIYHLEIAGESHMTADAASKVELLRPIVLVPEPDNPYDNNAIRIEIDGLKLGYVPRTKTKTVRRIMATEPIHCALYSIHRDRSKKPRSINALIWREGTIEGMGSAPHPDWLD